MGAEQLRALHGVLRDAAPVGLPLDAIAARLPDGKLKERARLTLLLDVMHSRRVVTQSEANGHMRWLLRG